MSCPVNLDKVDLKLQWNPYTRDREATPLWWDEDTISDSFQQSNIIPAAAANFDERFSKFEKRLASWDKDLKDAKQCAEIWARRLAQCHEGRVLLDAEDPGEYATDPEYWFARAAYYRVERERLMEEQGDRDSRSPTPGYIPPEFFGETELDRAKGSADLAAQCLANFPPGKALLEAEDHGVSSSDPTYWWSKEKYYRAEYWAIYQKTTLERVKRYADCTARDLATFPAGKALIEAEDHGDSAVDPGYWRSKKRYYKAEYNKLEEEFWERWKRTYLEGGESFTEVLDTSSPKIRKQKPSAPIERRSARVTRSTIQRMKGTGRQPLGALASSSNSNAGISKTKDARSTERHQSKNKYRRQNAHVAETKRPSPSQACSVAQTPYNGCATLRSDESRIRRSTTKELCKGSTQQRRPKVTEKNSDGEQKNSYPQSHNPYVTPSSPDVSAVRARQRRKRKDIAQRKRSFDKHSIHLGSRAASQPISSRLRSSTRLRGKRTLDTD